MAERDVHRADMACGAGRAGCGGGPSSSCRFRMNPGEQMLASRETFSGTLPPTGRWIRWKQGCDWLRSGAAVCGVGFLLLNAMLTPVATDRPSTAQVVKGFGYPVEEHEVKTDDGYILSIFRIPGPRRGVARGGAAEPFLVQHGLAMSSLHFVLWPNKSLPYLLADEGFDVWVTNVRGTAAGKRHETLAVDDPRFWEFSWHEHGVFDMPAIVDYVTATTGYRQVWYAGHSMGTTMMFVMQSVRPEYAARVRHFFALAPIGYMARMTSALKSTCGGDKVALLMSAGKAAALQHIPSEGPAATSFRLFACSIAKGPCSDAMANLAGRDKEQEFEGSFEYMSQYFPADASLGQLLHFGQHCGDLPNVFRYMDHGAERNRELYESAEPPHYNVSNVRSPMTWIYGESDIMGVPEDVEEFSTRFQHNPPKMVKIPYKPFDHMDFVIGRDQRKYVGEPMQQDVKVSRHSRGPIPRGQPLKPPQLARPRGDKSPTPDVFGMLKSFFNA